MLNAANKKNLLKQRTDRQAAGQKLNYIKLGGQQPDLKYKIKAWLNGYVTNLVLIPLFKGYFYKNISNR